MPPPSHKGPLDRVLSLFTDIRAGEGASALLMAANIFCILAFYSALKIVRDTLILTEGGAEVKSYSSAGQAMLMLALVPLYGAFASRVNRLWLVCGVPAFFASHLVVFAALGVSGVRVSIPFFIWTGIFTLVVTAQFWAFANDLYGAERGKRLFPLVGIGASLGALVGAGATSVVFGNIGPYRLMLISAAGLLIPVVLTLIVNGRERAGHRDAAAERADKPLASVGGFRLIFQQRYLLLIAMLFVVLNLVNTTGGYLLDRLIETDAFTRVTAGADTRAGEAALTAEQESAVQTAIGTRTATVQTWVNLVGFLLQAFVVSRVFKYIGVRGALFILPLIAMTGYSLIATLPILSVVMAIKIAENSTDYSIQNTARHALFLPTSREAKYKAKQAIDGFFWRAGDMLQAGVVFLGAQLAFGIRGFAVLNLALTLVWLGIVVAIAREHRKLEPADAIEKAA
jgi:AAA family ATP:ADP antiporter